jgi:hypothetical protein
MSMAPWLLRMRPLSWEALLFASATDYQQGNLFPDRVASTEEFYIEL